MINNLYHNMSELLQEGRTEHFELEKFNVDGSTFAAVISGVPSGSYIRLVSKADNKRGEVIMSDTPMEKRTNAEFVQNAHGDVLIAGLGIGLILTAIQDKPEVRSITVIEKEEEIIELVGEQLKLNPKVNIICEDIYLSRPEISFDCIYFDIWNYVNSDVYKDMLFLKDGFRRYLKPKAESPNRFIRCWAETNARYNLELR